MQPPDVDKVEQKQIESRGFRGFFGSPDETGIVWIHKKEDGSCYFLNENNKCSIYPVRPTVCRLEPFTIVDYDYEKNRIELDLDFPFSSCCTGTCGEKETVPVEEIAKAAQIVVQKILELTAKDMGLQVTDTRVHCEARSRLLRRQVELADFEL